MKFFKKYWPMPFKIKKGKFFSLFFRLIFFAIICAAVLWAIGLFAHIRLVGTIVSVLGIIVELYGIIGIILCFLVFFGIVKTRKKSSKRRKRSKKR